MAQPCNTSRVRHHAPRVQKGYERRDVNHTTFSRNPEWFVIDTAEDDVIIPCNDEGHAFAAAAAANRKSRCYNRYIPCHQSKDGFVMLEFRSRTERAALRRIQHAES